MGSTEQWACEELERMGLCDPQVIIHYLQPIEDPAEVKEYLTSLLDTAQPAHTAFIEEFLRRQHEAKAGKDLRFYRKPDLDTDSFKVTEKKKQKPQKESNGRVQRESSGSVSSTPPPSTPSSTSTSSTSSSGKKKSKFVNLYSEDGANKDVVLLSGRHKCECQASRHRLVGNCLSCGRVVCGQEGSGPCQFCGSLVVSREEREVLNRGSRKSEALQKRLLSERNATVSNLPPPDEQTDALQKAVEAKDRLLEFDRTSERRTRVLDDESDYFNVDSRWLADADREKLQQREEELRAKRFSRSGQTVTLDLVGRRVVEDELTTTIYDPEDPVVKEVLQGRSTTDIFSAPDREEAGLRREVSRPVYQDTGLATVTAAAATRKAGGKFSGPLRVQDRELQEMRDEGMCLSMHQPWAALLVAGIKVHEGRTWYSAHRGRLWIAAAAKIPQQEEIHKLENHYRALLGKDDIPFPHHYPAGCLLGCVDVADVLPQEEYRERHPEGESECPYVFVCRNPQEMVLKFPLKGQHKIFKLDPKIHHTAKKALRPNEE